ncbi:MAG: diguanylate cyclase [Gracilibacteraceae bacterium]|jgi:diguanylate cyclase (GGDEF)-like protein|nr:diguanylate cyclase [Gracilibacteraceae bacterium]
MGKFVQNLIVSNLMRKTFADNNQMCLYLQIITATLICAATHLYMLVFFILTGSLVFSIYNVFSLLFYTTMFLLLPRHHFTLIGLLETSEVLLYGVFFCVLTGLATYGLTYFVLIIIMQQIVPYGSIRLRTGLLATGLVLGLACVAVNYYVPPPVTFSDSVNHLLMVSNIVLLLCGVVIELYIRAVTELIVENVDNAYVRELSSQAYTDPLTGLYNRRYAEKHFEKAALKGEQPHCCVAMIDIDDFKQINDTYGHGCGDDVLVFLAGFLRMSLRKTDVVFRWGGEEFLIILEDVEIAQASDVMDGLRDRLAGAVIATRQGDLRITVTIGLAKLSYASVAESIEICDARLYEGKRSGKNRVVTQF